MTKFISGEFVWDQDESKGDDGLKYDSQEKDPDIRVIIRKAHKEAEEHMEKEMPDVVGILGSCHVFWDLKKKILKEKYNIDWKTPAEMNPDVMFD